MIALDYHDSASALQHQADASIDWEVVTTSGSARFAQPSATGARRSGRNGFGDKGQ